MALQMWGKAANEDIQMGLKNGNRLQESISWGVPQVPYITRAHGMWARRCSSPTKGDDVGWTMWASRPGAAALQSIWMLPQGMLADGLVRAEKLIATLNVEQDHVRGEAHSLSPAPVTVHCQDWVVEDVPI